MRASFYVRKSLCSILEEDKSRVDKSEDIKVVSSHPATSSYFRHVYFSI